MVEEPSTYRARGAQRRARFSQRHTSWCKQVVMGTRCEVNDRFPSISQHSDLCARSQTACHPLIHFVEQCSQRHTSLRLSSFRGRIRISSTFQSEQCIQCFHPAHTCSLYTSTRWRTLISSIYNSIVCRLSTY